MAPQSSNARQLDRDYYKKYPRAVKSRGDFEEKPSRKIRESRYIKTEAVDSRYASVVRNKGINSIYGRDYDDYYRERRTDRRASGTERRTDDRRSKNKGKPARPRYETAGDERNRRPQHSRYGDEFEYVRPKKKKKLSKKARLRRKRRRAIKRFVSFGTLIVIILVIVNIVASRDAGAQAESIVEKQSETVNAVAENATEKTDASSTKKEAVTGAVKVAATDFDSANCPESLLGLLDRNDEAAQFVYDYQANSKLYKADNIDISAEVSKGTVPSFIQWDERWGYLIYDDDYFAVNGCGPTCLSMVYSAVTGKSDYDPYKMGQVALKVGSKVKGGGTEWSAMTLVAKEVGIESKEIIFDKAHILEALEEGTPIICNVGPGDFTTGGHYIVLAGVNSDGTIKVNDPNSVENTQKSWDLERIMSQVKNLWGYSEGH